MELFEALLTIGFSNFDINVQHRLLRVLQIWTGFINCSSENVPMPVRRLPRLLPRPALVLVHLVARAAAPAAVPRQPALLARDLVLRHAAGLETTLHQIFSL